MKRLLFVLLLWASTSYAGAIIENRDDFNDYVREITGIEDTTLFPDSTLDAVIQEAVLWTSIECGGVEAQYRIVTVADQAWYVLPDSIVEILHATLLTEDGETYSVKAYYPQWFSDTDNPPKLGGASDAWDQTADDYPFGYNYWADTLQLFPIPTRVDTLILKCYIEHPLFQDTSSANDTLQFKPPYTNAAIDLATYMVFKAVDMPEMAAAYFQEYQRKRDILRSVYRRKFDILNTPKE